MSTDRPSGARNARFGMLIVSDVATLILSDAQHDSAQNSRVAFGRIIAADSRAALRLIAAVLGQGYQPGTVERGLFDMMATEPPTHGRPDVTYPAR